MTSTPDHWLPALLQQLECTPAVARIVLAEVSGSAPRECGTSMLVWPTGVLGTIGGGRLEWEAIGAARELLQESGAVRVSQWVLATDLGQCCGGVVTLWIERYDHSHLQTLRDAQRAMDRGRALLASALTPGGLRHTVVTELPAQPAALTRLIRGAQGEFTLLERLDCPLPEVWLYGAGHVGQALARILGDLPWRLTWIDSRAEWLPEKSGDRLIVRHCADPVTSLEDAPRAGYFIVVTHSHTLDYTLCRTLLARNDFAWIGMIGSKSKAARFRSRLAHDGIAARVIARLVCPVGVPGIVSKWPAAIAVAIAAQLLQTIGDTQAGDAQAGVTPVRAAAPATDCDHQCARCGTSESAPERAALTT